MATQDEKRIANEIMMIVRRLQLPLKLDEITEGRGNCFPLAILAQCRRLEIFRGLSCLTQNLIQQDDPTLFRRAVYSFMTNSRHKTIQNYIKRYQEILANIDNKTWEEYWMVMIKNYEWVDYIFIQSTAWYLRHDIIIVMTTSSENRPFITISGNITDENIPCPGIALTIGSKSSVHYQSLLPLEIKVSKKQIKPSSPENTINLNLRTRQDPKEADHADLDMHSREEFPDLSPPKVKKQDQTEAHISRRQSKLSNPKLNSRQDPKENDHPDLDTSSMEEFPDLSLQKENRKADSEASTSRGGIQKSPRQTKQSDPMLNKEQLDSKLNETKNKKPLPENASQNKYADKPERNDEVKVFKYKLEGKILNFKFVSDKRVNCPTCRNDFKNILRHLQKSGCKISCIDDLSMKFKQFTKVHLAQKNKDDQNRWKNISRAKQRKLDEQKYLDETRKLKAKSIAKQRVADNQKVKEDQNERKSKSIAKQRVADNQKVKQGQNERNSKFIAKQRVADDQKVKEGQNERKSKSIAMQRVADDQKVKQGQNERNSKFIAKQRVTDNQKVKQGQNERNSKFIAKQRVADDQKVKEGQNERKSKSIAKQRVTDDQKVKYDQNLRKRLGRSKRKLDDPKGLSEYEIEAQKKKRRLWRAEDRLREFKEATKYNAIFICSCCQRRLFHSSVEVISQKLKDNINDRKAGHFRDCIEEEIETPINGRNDSYLCKTCITHMKAKKMPPMSVKNNLRLEGQDDTLQLTELEGALIAKNLIFQKIYQLPKSRWTALTDRIINVPINDDDILNTVESLPRTPKEAGLIGVSLKRKLEYKNTHKRQLVNPEKIFKMLDTLKRAGNPHYQFHDDFNTYKERCEENDPQGHEVLFPINDDLEEDIGHMPIEEEELVNDEIMLKSSSHIDSDDDADDKDSDDDSDDELKDELDYLTNDPVRKYQFTYNKSLCMSNKYPEISAPDPTKDIEVAPGEGKIPNDIMREKDWDVKAFPHLHNPDGSNGKDEDRKTRLTEQSYFIQRILNKDKRFSKSPAYIYAAVAYIEKKQLQRNINISGTRGKRVETNDGGVSYELEDGYTVMDDIKNTPRYWKKVKYEMLAKLENLGAFQFFFTLSCADMRWEENYAAILRDQGLNLIYSVITNKHGNPTTSIEVEFQKDGKLIRKAIKQYLEDEVKSSRHEIIRGNVLLATRYFDDRVKKFMDLVVMGDNNPMQVEYYTYKVEFQDRGAGHIHGTLWLKLEKLERLIRTKTDDLVLDDDEHKDLDDKGRLDNDNDADKERPFKGISSAFKKLKNNEELLDSEKVALAYFIDEFTSVCTNKNIVGPVVSRRVLEVNMHSHTKSCRKYDCPCRFFFPRFPSIRTIIAQPITGVENEERNERLKKYEETLDKVRVILNDSEAVDEIIATIGASENEPVEVYKANKVRRIEGLVKKAGVTLQEYEEALSFTKTGYKVVIERDLTEIFINSYNIEWMEAWDGNMDIQPCFDFHATITYITDYFAKDDTGLMELINSVLKQDASETTKERMKTVANTFMTHRQIGEAEAVYRLLPNMLLKNSNVTCQWLSVGKRSEMSKRWKLATKKEIENRDDLVKIKDREGLWYQQQDMLSKFLRRPVEIELICPTQFSKMFTTSGVKSKKKDKIDTEENNPDEAELEEADQRTNENANITDEIQNNNYNMDKKKFHFIMTETEQMVPLPKLIEISDPYPGEPKWMRKRRGPAVIRYHKVNADNQYERWMLKELMLYTPFREADLDEYENNTAEVYKQKESWIRSVKSKVMEHLESIEEARYMVEQANKDKDLGEIGIQMDAALEQEQEDCQREGVIQHPDYIHLDTDGIEQTDKTKHGTSIFKTIVIPGIAELREETQKLDKFQREAVNISVKYAKDLVKSRRDGNHPPSPIFLTGHGGAGAGKSTVIDIVSKWCHSILSKEGDDIECPYIVKTAFTGTAASNIEGQTLHSSFGFNFDNKHYSLSDKTRDEKRTMFKNLKMIIIDEVSMVKSDMLYQLDLKLQELKERVDVPFGGVAILDLGDILQLRPVLGTYAFEKPKNPEFHATFHLHNRWEMFSILNLEVNHRQGEDKPYAEILNRIRIGQMTEKDIDKLRTRVRQKNHPDLKDVSLYIVPTRKACAKYNSEYLKSLEGSEILLKARHYHATQKKYKPFIDQKEGAVGTTAFQDELKLKVGANIIIIHNIDTSDGLTNGQLGELVTIINSKDGNADKLIIKLKKKDAGIQNRRKYQGLAMKYPESVVIERVTINYAIRKRGGAVGSTATLVQFPVKLAHAITAHKIQGQTIPKPFKVAFDIDSVFEEAQGYVMLSRVQELKQVFIINKFNPKKLYPSQKALRELERMNRVSINENPDPWSKKSENTLKIVSLNCSGLKAHFQDVKTDDRLLKADIIHLVECSLTDKDNKDEFSLEGYNQQFITIGPGKGIATYFKNDRFNPAEEVTTDKFQITKFKHEDMDIVSVYRSQSGHSLELLEGLMKMIEAGRITIITGDFNICFMENFSNRMTQGLLSMGFNQLVHEPTHIRGRHIDQVYFLDQNDRLKPIVDRYSPYYSDHDGICITIPELVPKHEEQ